MPEQEKETVIAALDSIHLLAICSHGDPRHLDMIDRIARLALLQFHEPKDPAQLALPLR